MKYVCFALLLLAYSIFDAPNGLSRYIYLYNGVCLVAILSFFLVAGKTRAISIKDLAFIIPLVLCVLLAVRIEGVFSVFNFILVLLTSYIFYVSIVSYPVEFRQAFFGLLVLNVTLFYIQVFYYSVSGVILDIHGSIFFWTVSRYSEYQQFGLFRATGMHNEPGTYSTVIAILILINLIFENKLNWFLSLSILTLPLTGSAAGVVLFIIIASCVILCFLLKERARLVSVKAFLYFGVVSLALFYFMTSKISKYLYWRFLSGEVESGGGTVLLKIESISFLLGADISRLVFGSGFGINDCSTCASLQDTGLLFTLIFQMGLLGVLFFLMWAFYVTHKNIFCIGLFFVLFMSKLPVGLPMVVVSFYMIRYNKLHAREDSGF